MIYHYKAVDQMGKVIDDLMAATNQKEVADLIKSKGLVVLEVNTEDEWRAKQKSFSLSSIRFGQKVSLMEKFSLARHMATMIDAGVPLAESLDILAHDTNNPLFKKILEESKYGLESGKALSVCFTHYPDVFDKGFINMLRAGEISGKLVGTLEHIAKKLKQDYELVSRIKAAMMYPAVIFAALILVGLLMLIFVVPKIADVFVRLNVDIPLPTKILLFTSNIFIGKPLISFSILIALVIIFVIFIKSQIGKKVLTYLIHWLPLVNKLARQVDLSRFNHSMSLLLKSGVPITESLEIAADTISDEKIKKIIMGFKKNVSEGEPLAQSFRNTQEYFPQIMTRMISVGEKTGKLDQILEELAKFYRKETEQTLQTISNLIEPILMFIVGIVIGAMVLAIIGPMYSVVQQISK